MHTKVLNNLQNQINGLQSLQVYGRVLSVRGLVIEVGGMNNMISIGDHCIIYGSNSSMLAEVVSFSGDKVILMPYGSTEGIAPLDKVTVKNSSRYIYPHPSWKGRVINGLGEPIDGKGALIQGDMPFLIRGTPLNAHSRERVGKKIDTGVKSLNTFLSCCYGQRMGIFSGSGVGKSSLLSNITIGTNVEITVIGLVGERGREAREFIEDDLGEEGLLHSVIVVSTSDEPPLMRRRAAYMTLAISEYFRDIGNDVLCMMDSITRFAMAQREISLSIGEPPASKGYTPSVFAELPRLLERAGPGLRGGASITGLFTVLVDGDDTNEPISDAVRGILDGHIILDRAIAERGRYPAVNILRSVSRTMPACNTDEQNMLVRRARTYISAYEDMAELIRLGAYRKGTDALVDEAIYFYPMIEEFLQQNKSDVTSLNDCYHNLAKILQVNYEGVNYSVLQNSLLGDEELGNIRDDYLQQ